MPPQKLTAGDGPQPGNPVPAAWPFCRLDDIASFRPGTWNGVPYTAEFTKQLAENFKRFSTGPDAYYRPYVSINHKDYAKFAETMDPAERKRLEDSQMSFRDMRFGELDAVSVDKSGLLKLSAGRVPAPVGAMRNSGLLSDPSIEFFEPVKDAAGNLIDGFRGPDGKIVDGPVIKCLTLLGSEAPAVKGLPPLPVAKFAHGGRVRKFGVVQMDRAGMISALQALGMDTAAVTDATPDEVIAAMLALAQKLQSGAPAANPDAAGDAGRPPVMPMSDLGGALGGAAPAAPAAVAGAPAPTGQPSQVVYKFADASGRTVQMVPIDSRTAGFLTGLQQQVGQLANTVATLNRNTSQQSQQAKAAKVKAFCDRLAAPDRNGLVKLNKAQRDAVEPLLMLADDAPGSLKKFSDGKTYGTPLEESMKNIEATYPPVPLSREKIGDAAPNKPGGSAGGAGGRTVSPEVRRQMLEATDAGRAILARQAAAARN